jgi:hypothetical protein
MKTVHIFLVLCTNLCTPSCVHGVQQAFNLISRTAVQNILNEQPRFERLQKICLAGAYSASFKILR